MARPALVRWLVPTVVLLGLGWLYSAYGHATALAVMLVLLVGVAALAGPGRDREPGHSAGGPGDATDGDAT